MNILLYAYTDMITRVILTINIKPIFSCINCYSDV